MGSMSLIIGTPGSGKSTMGKQFLYGALTRKVLAVLLDTHESFELAKETMASFEWDKPLLESVVFVDCYSWRTGAGRVGKYSGTPMNLTELSLVIRDLFNIKDGREHHARLVIDSFSDFVTHAGPEVAIKFLESLKARMTERKITSLVILEDGLHDPKVNASVEYVTDGTIRMRYQENGRSLMVSRMIATPVTLKWVPFELARGIEVSVTDYFR